MPEILHCDRCGGDSPTDARFCIDCGGPIGAAVAPRAESDYHQTIEGFAQNVLVRLSPRNNAVVAVDSPAVKAGRVKLAR